MSDRRTTSDIRKARVIRPPVLAVQEDDTDETHPVKPAEQRTRTPADETLAEMIPNLSDLGVPPEIQLALEAIANRGAEDRKRLEAQLLAVVRKETRWSRAIALVKSAGAATLIATVLNVGAALVRHGTAQEQSRARAENLLTLRADVELMKKEVETLRAQAAAVNTILIPAARLPAIP